MTDVQGRGGERERERGGPSREKGNFPRGRGVYLGAAGCLKAERVALRRRALLTCLLSDGLPVFRFLSLSHPFAARPSLCVFLSISHGLLRPHLPRRLLLILLVAFSPSFTLFLLVF